MIGHHVSSRIEDGIASYSIGKSSSGVPRDPLRSAHGMTALGNIPADNYVDATDLDLRQQNLDAIHA
jgi:hypothetical protein